MKTLEKEEVLRLSSKLQLWAGKGYYIFWAFLVLTIISFSLIIINLLFFLLAIGMVIISIWYGSRLYKYLLQ